MPTWTGTGCAGQLAERGIPARAVPKRSVWPALPYRGAGGGRLCRAAGADGGLEALGALTEALESERRIQREAALELEAFLDSVA